METDKKILSAICALVRLVIYRQYNVSPLHRAVPRCSFNDIVLNRKGYCNPGRHCCPVWEGLVHDPMVSDYLTGVAG
jgi:hypothetical protein